MGVACTAISCRLEWDGEGRHRSCGFIHVLKKLGGEADVGVEGERIGEQLIREAMVVESARLMRMWICGGARGLVLGRVFWRALKMQCGVEFRETSGC